VELSLLLPGRHVLQLDRLAQARGLTLGQLVRRVIHEYLARHARPDLGGPGDGPHGYA
jgi:hypothetical protein